MTENDERFIRTVRLLGRPALRKLQDSRVVVVGLGAVGSYAVEGLARGGVGALRLVDFDVVRPSNINRQLYALESTLGQPKAELAKGRVLDINPRCRVEALRLFAHADTLETILAGPPDLVVDAIDALNPKVELITAALRRKLPLLSSMGAARRTDPAAIRVGPFAEVQSCRLARMVRRRLRRRQLPFDFPCVYSNEPTTRGAEDEEAWDNSDFVGSGRPRRLMGSLPTITGLFGLRLAHAAIFLLLGKTQMNGLGATASGASSGKCR